MYMYNRTKRTVFHILDERVVKRLTIPPRAFRHLIRGDELACRNYVTNYVQKPFVLEITLTEIYVLKFKHGT